MPNGLSTFETLRQSAARSREVSADQAGRVLSLHPILDEITVLASQANADFIDLGPVGLMGFIPPDAIRFRYNTTATANFTAKIVKVDSAGANAVDLTGATTFDNSGVESGVQVAATAAPLITVLPTDRLRFVFVAITTATTGHKIGVEILFYKRQLNA
jgi:hypothetical protein